MTGGNKGIGLAIVKKLLSDYPDTLVLLGSRDIDRGNAAIEDVIGDLTSAIKPRVELIQLDVCSEASVTAALENVKSKHGSCMESSTMPEGSLTMLAVLSTLTPMESLK